MGLPNINEELSMIVGVLAEPLEEGLAIGHTFETNRVRVHRYVGSIVVTDLTNAGKRGEMVDKFVLYGLDCVRDSRTLRAIERFAKLIQHSDYRKLLALAKNIVRKAESAHASTVGFGSTPHFSMSKVKGVRIAKAGFKKIIIDTRSLIGYAGHDGFRITDRGDPRNEPTLIEPTRGKRTATKQFYAWVGDNEKILQGMDFSDVMIALRKAGIGMHYYMAVD